MKLLIADGHEVVRLGLKDWCKGWTLFEASDIDDAAKLYRKHKPDVTVIESRLPGDGLECLSRIKAIDAGSHVLMFSGYDNPTYVARAIALGAQGYLSKSVTNKEFVAAVKSVAAGDDVWTRDELRRVSGALAGTGGQQLTKREGEVLKQLAFGLTNKEIAQALGISYETVKEHVQHILRKLGVTDRTQAAVWAVRNELV
jgi:DNA-binding NarL/FixJ family response regulator